MRAIPTHLLLASCLLVTPHLAVAQPATTSQHAPAPALLQETNREVAAPADTDVDHNDAPEDDQDNTSDHHDAQSSTVIARPADDRVVIEATGSAQRVDLRAVQDRTATITDALRPVPGLQIRRMGGAGAPAYVQMRGAAPWHTQVLLDGIPLHGPGQPTFDLDGLDPALFDRVTIYAADAPLAWGTPMPGGALQLEVGNTRRDSIDVLGTAGSWGTRAVLGSIRRAARPGRVDGAHVLSLAYRGQTGDFLWYDDGGTRFDLGDDRTRTRTNNAHDRLQLLARSGMRAGHWRLTLLATGGFTAREHAGPTYLRVAHAHGRASTLTTGVRAVHPGTRTLPVEHALVAGVSWWRNRLLDPEAELGAIADDRTEHNLSARLAWQPTWRHAHGAWLWRIAGGLDATIDQHRAADTVRRPRVERAVRLQPGAFLQATTGVWQDTLTAHAGVRIDHARDTITGDRVPPAPEQTLVSPRAGVTARHRFHDDWLVQAAAFWGVAHRMPAFAERYPDQGTTAGNPDLRPEQRTGVSTRVLLTYAAAPDTRLPIDATLTWSFHDQQVRDLIVWVETGMGASVPQNIDRAALRGHELALDLRIARLRLGGSYTLLDALNRTPDSQRYNARLPSLPVHEGSAFAEVRLWHFEIGGQLFARASQFLDASELRPIPQHTTGDVWLRWHLPWTPGLSVTARVDDIADARIRDIALPDGGQTRHVPQAVADWAGHPLPGRSAFVTLRWNWEASAEDMP